MTPADQMRISFALMADAADLSASASRLRARAFALRGYDESMQKSALSLAATYDSERIVLLELAATYPQ